jgi:hypothetical protein
MTPSAGQCVDEAMGYGPKRGLTEVQLTIPRRGRSHLAIASYQGQHGERTLTSMWWVLVRRTSNSTGDPQSGKAILLKLNRLSVVQRIDRATARRE